MAAQQYSDEDLLDHLRDLSDGETGPTTGVVEEADGPCAQTYRDRFGSFTTAIEAAGLEPVGRGGSSGGVGLKYPRGELLSWIEAYVAEFGEVPESTDADTWPGPVAATYRDRFGGWPEAVRAAGYEPRNESGGAAE